MRPEAHANGWLGEVEGLQVSLNAAMAKLASLNRTSTDGRPQLVDLGMPLFTATGTLLRLDHMTGEAISACE
uniref:hypothetical protein n=1 Tax=Streptomyces sp. NBC_01001 TaxID=2903713 RepID=UPI002F912E88|nr:hypothetical protein OG296_42180 [Streptomyces sp. NBC_01001]